MHVESSTSRERQDAPRDHLAEVEGEEEIRLRGADALFVGGVAQVNDAPRLDAVLARELCHGIEPALFARRVVVRVDEAHALAGIEERLQALVADVGVSANDDSAHQAPHTFRMRKRGRPRTCW